MIENHEVYTSEQLAEMRELKIAFNTFRENLLLNENMQPFMMNLILYCTSFFEMLMVAASYLASCIPVLLFMAYILTRKHDFCRSLVIYLFAKTIFFIFNDDSYKF
jgi:hypothetical protein